MPSEPEIYRVHRLFPLTLLVVAISSASCGGAQSSTNPAGPAFAREGASSGAMSRVGTEDDALVPIPPAPSYATPTPRPAMTSNLGGDEVANGSASTPTPIGLGQSVHGRLQEGDTPLADGSVGDDYVFVAPAGVAIHVELHGGEVAGQPGSHMDMYLHLLHEGAEITHDDDGGGNLDSLIETTLPTSGAYVLRVTTFGSGLRAGAYTLVLRQQ
jgi:hypothetical protein